MKHTYEGITYKIDEILSFKDFTGMDLRDYPKYDFNNKIIYGSCFSQETPDSKVFDNSTNGATFIKCNLSNVLIPEGNTIIDCQTKRFKVQNDLRDWEIDHNDVPKKVMNEKYWIRKGYSVDPLDIPASKAASLDSVKKV